MLCNCSNAHNYQVIGLCNPQSITLTGTQPWAEVSVPELIKISSCCEPVENIDKIFISAKVMASKVIATPHPTVANSEGLSLTGKKLVVDLELCETIIYTADVPEQSVHAIQRTTPFCTYLVLPADTDVETAQFCVNTCIEDVSARVMDCNTIFKGVTLFITATPLTNPECLFAQ